MTTEQPTRPARPPRPGPAFRRAALGLPPDPDSDANGGTAPVVAARESLRDSLARIPDLDRGRRARPSGSGMAAPRRDPGASPPSSPVRPERAGNATDVERLGEDDGPAQSGGVRALASRLLNGPVPDDAVIADPDEAAEPRTIELTAVDPDDPDIFAPDTAGLPVAAVPVEAAAVEGSVADAVAPAPDADAPEWLLTAAEQEKEAAARVAHRNRPHRSTPMWRRVGFAVAVVLLIASIPVLGRIGYTLVTESTDGVFISNIKSPTDPGYESEVVSTPTQLLLHQDAEGRPVGATVLSLSGAEGGGAVIFVPLAAEVRSPAFGVDRLSRAYDVLSERPPDGRKQVAVQVASLLNVGIDSVVEVDDRGWAQLVGPVAPLTITNPTPLTVDGVEVPSGEIELTAEQVGPYLAASRPGETPINALLRHELVWDAWLDAVAESDRDDVVPGETTSGIGLFARTMADGPVTYSVVPTTADPDIDGLLRVDEASLNQIVLAAVPSPDPATPGSRPTVRLLNGVSAEEIPAEIIQKVVQIGGSVSVIGNGPTFGRDETTIVYANPDNEGYAELLKAALGGGTVRRDPEAEESVALTVILGRDVVENASATTTTDLATESGGS